MPPLVLPHDGVALCHSTVSVATFTMWHVLDTAAMQEQGETTVSIRGIGTTNTEAVQVTVDRSSPLSDIKKVLADLYDRPEIAADGQFLKQMPNGATVKMHDAQKIGTRKELLYEGPPLAVVSEAIPLTNLDEFDGFDEKVDVLSPRSLRALDLQGVSPDELYYAPAECFWEPDLDRRIMQLHHDFVEAWRQDTLSMCRAQRRRILEQDVAADSESPGLESWTKGTPGSALVGTWHERSTVGKTPSSHEQKTKITSQLGSDCYTSKGATLRTIVARIEQGGKQDDAVDRSQRSYQVFVSGCHATLLEHLRLARLRSRSLERVDIGKLDASIVSQKQGWTLCGDGDLEFKLDFLSQQDLQYWMQLEKVLERSHPGLPPHARAESQPSKGAPKSPFSSEVSGKTAKEAVEEVERQRRRSSKQRHQALQYAPA
ncbi:gpt [Symbiodinium necroappetens]|uniref:Gpt protein n=1 Tax=Symbiodinium necroappetens TaxID=1628268 RepID=A0A813BLJ9_9DINO|nr:gpt [Symbiodinium necroappetens]